VDEDWNTGRRATTLQAAQDVAAIHPRHVDVEQDQGKHLARCKAERFGTTKRLDHLESLEFKYALYHRLKLVIVIYDQNPRTHASPLNGD